MARLFTFFALAFWLVSCGPIVDVKIVSNPKPQSKPGNEEPVDLMLHEVSLKETRNGTKGFVINALIDASFASAVGLGENACAQIVELSDGRIIADFGDVACPEAKGMLEEENIKFSLRYVEPDEGTTFTIVLNDEMKVFGTAEVDPFEQTVTLTALCTGEFAGTCTLTIEETTFSAFTEL